MVISWRLLVTSPAIHVPRAMSLTFFSILESNELDLPTFLITVFSPSFFFFPGIYCDFDERILRTYHSELFNCWRSPKISCVYADFFFNLFGNIFHIFLITFASVVYYRAIWCSIHPTLVKIKKSTRKKFLTSQEMEHSNSKIKKFLILSQKKVFLIFPEMELCIFQTRARKNNRIQPLLENFLYLLNWKSQKNFLYFLKKSPLFSGNGNPGKFLIFQETELSYGSGSNFPRSKVFYTFSYKEAKIFKLKYFLIIIIWHFFSFYNIFFYTQQAFVFPLLREFL